MNKITLQRYEIIVAAEVGLRRQIMSLDSTQTNKVNNKDFGWHTHIEAACSEMVVAKLLNIYWDGSVGTYKAPDVGEYQVRHSQQENASLIVREKDSPSEIYILVVGICPFYTVCGWILGGDAKQNVHHRKGYNGMPDAWFVEQCNLNPIETLKVQNAI